MDQITVKSKFGQLGTIDKNDLPSALSHGFTLAKNEEIQSHNDQQQYGSGMLNPLVAGLEEAASTATFGASRQLEDATGLTTPEDQAARAKYNPTSQVIGAGAGLIADPFGMIGKTAKVGGRITEGAGKIIGKAPEGAGFLSRAIRNAPAAAVGAASEGAAFGVGQSVADQAMGDPDALGEHLMSNVGYGSLIAGGLGGMLETGANAFGKTLSHGGSSIQKLGTEDGAKMASYKDDISRGADAQAEGMGAPQPEGTVQGDQPFSQFKEGPKSLEDIQAAVKTNYPVVPEGMPSYNALKEAVDGLPDLQFKPHNLQYESLTDQGLRDYYKTFLEGQSDESKALRDYEALQKSEATTKLDNTINDLAQGQKLSANQTSAGDNAVKAFTDQYQSEKEALGPLFKQFDKAAEGKKINSLNPLLGLHDEFPEIAKYINADKDGVFKIDKYSPEMPFSKNTYGAIKDLVSASNSKDLTLSGLRNVRESMRDRITLTSGPRDQAQIGSIRKMLMDQMQDSISKIAPDLDVRNTFKRYAQNEEKRGIIESILGGSVSDKASFGKTIKSEDVLNKIFSNTVSTGAAKDILGKDFNKVLADYLNQTRAKVTDEAKNGFSSNKFATFLKGKNPELLTALAENPQALKRIGDLTDYMRILPDSPSVNPSGTAKTLTILDKIAGLSRNLKPTNAIADFAQKFADKSAAERQKYTIGEVLSGKHLGAAQEAADERYLQTSKLAKIERFVEDSAYRIENNAKALFKLGVDTARKSVGLVGSKLAPKGTKKEDTSKAAFAQIMDLQTNPEKMIDTLQKATASIYPHAPGISQGVQSAATRATEFLAGKIPPMPPKSPFSEDDFEPNKSQIAQFERYYNVIEDPIGSMGDIKLGTVTPETVETLSTVYPKLYDQMKMSIIEQASKVIGKKEAIPYQLRQAIGTFIGEPVDDAMLPQNVMNTQAIFVPHNQAHAAQSRPSKGGMAKLSISKRTGIPNGTMET